MGDKSACLEELKRLVSVSKAFDPKADPENYQIGKRNPPLLLEYNRSRSTGGVYVRDKL